MIRSWVIMIIVLYCPQEAICHFIHSVKIKCMRYKMSYSTKYIINATMILWMNFARTAAFICLLYSISTCHGVFNVRKLHTGPPILSSVSDRTRCSIPPINRIREWLEYEKWSDKNYRCWVLNLWLLGCKVKHLTYCATQPPQVVVDHLTCKR